jgi:two-component system, NtrC family, sensor kinase
MAADGPWHRPALIATLEVVSNGEAHSAVCAERDTLSTGRVSTAEALLANNRLEAARPQLVFDRSASREVEPEIRTMSLAGLARLKAVCGLVVAIIGLSALAGWGIGERSLSGIRSDYIPMAPNTAVAFLLLGSTLLAIPDNPGSLWRKAVAVGTAGFVAGLVAFRLAEYALSVDLGVHGWFMEVPSERLGLVPVGKMALFTALCFLAASVAALLIALAPRQPARDAAGLLGLAVTASGLVFSLGYLYAAPLFYGGPAIPMALNTAIAFCVTGVGLIGASGPRALPARPFVGTSIRAQLLRAFLPFTVVVVLVSDWLTQAVVWFASPSFMALASAASVVFATVIAAVLCWLFAGQIGGRIDRAEAELRSANELLETRVLDRTRALHDAKALLEERNDQLQHATDDLRRTADSVRTAHQELQIAHEELKRAETQLVQSERLSSLGQLVAGVAHEINNPLAFVTNNVALLQRDVGHLHDLIRLYQQAEGTLEQHQHELLSNIHSLAEQMDLAYVLDNVPALMTRSREGLKRIQKIVKDLRDFVRLDDAELMEVDLNENVIATLTLLRSQASGRGVSLVEDLVSLPHITCYPAKINQVLLCLVSNGIEACDPGGTVTVSSRPEAGQGVILMVTDTGRGIAPAIRGRIFDPFFTTKPIGQGTGLGLAISHGIIKSHGGTIDVESAPGLGARFAVHLPASPPPDSTGPVLVARESTGAGRSGVRA